MRLHFTPNNLFFLTLYLCFQSCRLHLSWSYTCISTFLHCRDAMSSTCNPSSLATSLDTSDYMPPSCAHFHELLLQPFQPCWCPCQDRGNLCLVALNILYLDNLLICLVVKLREREGQRVDLGRSLKGHLYRWWMVDGGYPFPDALH